MTLAQIDNRGKSGRLAVGRVACSMPLPGSALIAPELVGALNGSRSPLVREWVNERYQWYNTLNKSSTFMQ